MNILCGQDSSECGSTLNDTRSSESQSGSEYCPASDWDEDHSFSSGCSSDWGSAVAHYLEEGPDAEDQPPNDDHPALGDVHAPADEPDPPDGNSSSSSSEESEESEDDNDHEVGTFHSEDLNRDVQLVQNLTKGEVMSIELASAVRHRKTFESIIDTFKNLNLLFGPHYFPESKTKLWSDILLNKTKIQYHVYCGRKTCGRYIGRRSRIVNFAVCWCGYRVPIQKAKFFATLDLATQLKYFLSIPGIWQKLQYPQTRQKISATAIEDILDGQQYLRLKQEGGPLSNPNNFSYVFSCDSARATKKGSLKVHPITLRINELPQNMRQKFHFPAAVFVDHGEPNIQTLMKPFVKQARRLATRGLNWRPDENGDAINSKFIPLCFNVDSPVRYCILNLSKWDSQYGCTYCTHRGIRVAGSQRYPTVNLAGIPPFNDRSHQGMVAAMRQVEENPNVDNFEGHKGATALLLLPHLDLRDGQAQDDLHQDHEGGAAHITELLLTTAHARVIGDMPFAALIRAIDERMLSQKTPQGISRKPRSIGKRSQYSGSEWRNWLFYYCIPCLLGLILPQYLDILAAYSHACYLLSKDSIEPQDFITADMLFHRVSVRFEQLFGVESLRYNLHVTTKHKVRCVQNLGPPYAYTTYNFESLLRVMIGKVTSPKGAHMQIVTRVLLHMCVYAAQYDQRLSEYVRLRIQDILNPYQLQRIHQVGEDIFLVGRGVPRATTHDEAEVLARENLHADNLVEYKGFLKGSIRFCSSAVQNQDSKSDDSFVYTFEDTFCTLNSIFSFRNADGEEITGAFVTEHDVAQVLPVIRHLSILRNDENADLPHVIPLTSVRYPAVKMTIRNAVYAVCVPSSFDLD